MANKKISELTTRTPSLSDLMLVGDPSSGYSFKCTVTALATIIETDIADGYVTLGTAQTISGAKTFSNNLTLTSVSNAGVDTDKFLVLSGSNVVNFRTGAEVLSDIGAQAALTNPITGTGTSGQVSYFNGTNSITSSPTFAFTPTSQLLVNNSVTAAGAIARGINATPSLTAAANNDVLVGIDVNPTFTNGAFTGVSNLGLRVFGTTSLNAASTGFEILATSNNFFIETAANGTYRVANLINYSGYSPGARTNVTADVFSVGFNGSSSSNGNRFFRINSHGGNSTGAYGASGNNNILAQLNSTTSSYFYISAQGSVGLIEQTANANFKIASTNAGNGLELRADRNGVGSSGGGIYYYASQNGTNDGHRWYHNLNEQMRLFFNGNLFIGSTPVDGGFRLDVNGTARVQGTTTISGDNNLIFQRATDGNSLLGVELRNSGGTERGAFKINMSTGEVRIGATNGGGFFPTFFTNGVEGGRFTGAGTFQTSASVTAASAIARGVNFTNTLVAAANNDFLVGLDINPTFTNGAFTGVSNLGLRVSGNASVSLNQNAVAEIFLSNSTAGTSARSQLQVASNGDAVTFGKYSSTTTTYKIVNARDAHIYNLSFGDIAILNDNSSGGIKFAAGGSSTVQARIFANGNFGINQNTDAGFKLDIAGTARVQGNTTITGAVSATANGHRFGNLEILTTGTAGGTGQGIVITGIDQTFQFQGSTSGGVTESFRFTPWAGTTTTQAMNAANKAFVRVYGGFTDGNTNNLSGNQLWLSPTYNFAGTRTGIIVRGIYYNPTLTSLTNTTHRAIETETGDVVFGSTSGNVMIGTTTAGGRFTIQPTNDQVGMAISGSSLTGSNAQSLVSLSQTWNTTGNPTAIKLDVTNTASGANSYLLDLQVGGIPQFTVFKGGEIKTSSPAGGVAQTWKLGSVQAVTPTSPNRTIEVEVNGTTYYIHAKTTND